MEVVEKEVIGVDGYNMSITGKVTMTVTCAASDCHHVPLVIVAKGLGLLLGERGRETAAEQREGG